MKLLKMQLLNSSLRNLTTSISKPNKTHYTKQSVLASKFQPFSFVSTSFAPITCSKIQYGLWNSSSFHSRSFSSTNDPKGTNVSLSDTGSVSGDDWAEKVKGVLKFTGEKAKEASDEVSPHIQQLFDTYPYLREVVVPVGGTLVGTLLAWSLLPRFLKQFHKYSNQGPAALLSGSTLLGPVAYEKSFWGALEDPVRYLVTFMAFLQVGGMVAPTIVLPEYVGQAWKGAVVMAFVWFVHRWKSNVITRVVVTKSGVERDRLLTLDKVSSVGLFVVGSMALAEACGVAVQSILTVGGVGGVATAFAAKDILGNVFSGLSVQLSQPFTIGEKIKAGSVEGQVVEIGLTSTSLLTAEKFPVIVPNSLFSSQVIVNKSRAKWRGIVKTVPLRTDDVDMIPQISADIKSMLRSHPNVYLEMEAPYCFLSRIERSYAELTIGCNLNSSNKEAEEDVLLNAVRIIKGHGVDLGSSLEDTIK